MSDSENKMDRAEAIRNRAYAIWLEEGRVDGRDKDHWRQAETQIDGEASPSAAQKADSRKTDSLKEGDALKERVASIRRKSG